MSISFQLNLSPRQIEFLQQLDLYEAGLLEVTEVGVSPYDRAHFVGIVGQLIRRGLAEHVIPVAGKTRYQGQVGAGKIIQAYRISEKGRAVLGLIEDDVQAFLSRQKAYQKAKRKRA